MIALRRKLPLHGLRALQVQHVLDRNRHQLRYLADEFDIAGGVWSLLATTEAERTEPSANGCEGQATEAADALLPDLFHCPRPAGLGGRIGDHQGPLRLDHPTEWRIVDPRVTPGSEIHTGRLENPNARPNVPLR